MRFSILLSNEIWLLTLKMKTRIPGPRGPLYFPPYSYLKDAEGLSGQVVEGITRLYPESHSCLPPAVTSGDDCDSLCLPFACSITITAREEARTFCRVEQVPTFMSLVPKVISHEVVRIPSGSKMRKRGLLILCGTPGVLFPSDAVVVSTPDERFGEICTVLVLARRS